MEQNRLSTSGQAEYQDRAKQLIAACLTFNQNVVAFLETRPDLKYELHSNPDYIQAAKNIEKESQTLLDANAEKKFDPLHFLKLASHQMATHVEVNTRYLSELCDQDMCDKKEIAALIPDNIRNEESAQTFNIFGAKRFSKLCLMRT